MFEISDDVFVEYSRNKFLELFWFYMFALIKNKVCFLRKDLQFAEMHRHCFECKTTGEKRTTV